MLSACWDIQVKLDARVEMKSAQVKVRRVKMKPGTLGIKDNMKCHSQSSVLFLFDVTDQYKYSIGNNAGRDFVLVSQI